MLDVYKFLEEKKKQTLPPGIVDLSSAPRVSMPAPPQKTPSFVPVTPAPSAPDIQPTVQPIQPQADLMRSFRALEAATPTPEQQRVVEQLKTIAKPPAVDMVTGAAPSVKPPDVSGADLARSREQDRARAIMSGTPAVKPVDYSQPTVKLPSPDTQETAAQKAGGLGLRIRASLTGRTPEQVESDDTERLKRLQEEERKEAKERKDRIAKQYPEGHPVHKFWESGVGQYIQRVGEIGGQAAAPGKSTYEELPSTGNAAVDFTADIIGTIMGFTVPGGVGRMGYEIVSPVSHAAMGRLLTTKAGERVLKTMASQKVIQELGPVPSPIKDMIGRVAARAVIGGLTSGITFSGRSLLMDVLNLEGVPDAKKAQEIAENMAKDFGWGFMTGAILGGGRAIIKEAKPYMTSTSMVRQGYREIKDPATKKGLGIYWKEVKPKAGQPFVEFVVTKPTEATLQTRLDYLNKYAQTEWAQTSRGKEMVARIQNTVDAYEIGKTGAYTVFPEKARMPVPAEQAARQLKAAERIAALRAKPDIKPQPVRTGLFGERIDLTPTPSPLVQASRARSAEFAKTAAPMRGAEQVVYSKILEQGGTRQEAQQIVEQINDVFAKHGLEFNIGNVVKHFGDVLGVTYSGATGKAWKPTAKADKAEEPVIPPAEATVTPQTPEEIRRAMQEFQLTQQAERERQAAEEELQAKEQEKEKAKKIREMEKRIAELMGGKPTAKAPAAPTAETETTPTTEAETTPDAERRTNLALRAEVDKLSPEEKDEVIRDLRARVFTDELTGLKNRAAYMIDEKQPFQAIIDLDNLKWVNDNIGHGAGDTLIKTLAAELPEGSYRLSGDEFVVQGQSQEELAAALSDIETRLNEQVLELAGDKQAVSKKGIGFSYGIGETLDKAETALQEHKKARLAEGKRVERGEVPPGIDISKREEDTIQTIKPNSVVRSTAGSTAGKLYTVLKIDGNKATVKSHDTGQTYRLKVSTLELVEDSVAGVTPTPETGVSQPPTTEAAEGEGVTDDILNKNIEKILEPYKFMIHMRTYIDWIDSLAEGSRGDDATDEYGNSLREAVKSMLIYPAGLSKAQAEQKVAEMEASFDQAEKERSPIRAKFGLANALAERPSRSKSFFTEEQYKKDKDYEIIEQAVVEGLLTKTAHTDRDGEKGYLFQRKGDLWSFLVKQGYYAEMGITATDDVEPETKAEEEAKPAELTPVSSGKTVTAKTERGTAIEAKYAVVEADSLVASHDTRLKENPAYPKELQPRDRTRMASESQINRIAQKLEPEFLGESPKVSEGAPIVGKDGIVESGNARTIALQRLYEQKHKNAELYKNWIKDNAEKFGIDKETLKTAKNPVLVRIRQTDIDRVKFTQEANEQAVAAMSASEQAQADAKRLTGKLMEVFNPSESGDIVTAGNRRFIGDFLSEVVSEAERGKYVTKDGSISQEGVARIRNAVFAKAYGDTGAIEKLAESTDANVKNQINAMLIAAPRLIKLNEAMDKGELYDLNISHDLAAAMNKLSYLRETGQTVDNYLRQMSLVEDLSPLAKEVLYVFDKHKRSSKRIASILQAYADSVELAGNPKQLTILTRQGAPSKKEIWTRAVRKAEGLDEEALQTTIFQSQGMGDKGTGQAGEKAAAGTEEELFFIEPEIKIAKATSRSTGAVGAKAITPRYVMEHVSKDLKILDYGAGKDAAHTKTLREAGFLHVEAHDFHAPNEKALRTKHDVTYASNVLNVQSSESMMRETLEEIRGTIKIGGKFIANYPKEPRKSKMTVNQVKSMIEDIIGPVERVGGTASAPLWEATVTAAEGIEERARATRPDPTRIDQVEFDVIREIPPEITLEKPDYASDILEFTRQLESPARYEKLRSTVAGKYVPADEKIAIRDIRRTVTLAHEAGHVLDYRLNNNNFPRTIKARFPNSAMGEKHLREELKKVSQIMRPVEGGPDNFDSYRRRHTELMADFYSMYLLDPDLARETAPVVAVAFEAKLNNNPKLKRTVAELLDTRGKIDKEFEKIREIEAIVKEKMKTPKTTPEEEFRNLVENPPEDYIEATKRIMLVGQRAAKAKPLEAKIKAEKWKKDIGNARLEDLAAYAEKMHNIKTGKTYEEIEKSLTPKEKAIIKEYRFNQELARQQLNVFMENIQGPEYISYLEDYILHVYAASPKQVKKFAGRWTKNVPSSKQRKFPTYKEAVEAGFVPLTQNLADLYVLWTEMNWKGAINQQIIKGMENVINKEGQPIIQRPKGAPVDWPIIDHPAIQRLYAVKGKSGLLQLWRGGAAVDPEAYKYLKNIFDRPFTGSIVKGIETFNAYAKSSQLSFSMFHYWNLTESIQATIARPKNPARGIVLVGNGEETLGTGIRIPGTKLRISRPHIAGKKLLESGAFRDELVMAGLQVDPHSDAMVGRVNKGLAELEAKTRRIPGLNHLIKAVQAYKIWFDKGLWDNYHSGIKAYSFYTLTAEALRHAPENISQKEIQKTKEIIAELINDAIGGQEWEAKFWAGVKGRQILQMAFLAPDYSISNINVARKALWPSYVKNPVARRVLWWYWINMALSMVAVMNALNYAFTAAEAGDIKKGKLIWQNEYDKKWTIDVTSVMRKMPWVKEDDKRRFYITPGKQAREVVRYVTDPLEVLGSKSSPAAQILFEQWSKHQVGTGWPTPWAEDDMSFYQSLPSRMLAVMDKFRPFTVRGNNFAATFPMRRGMGWWQAQRGYEDLIRAAIDPKWYSRLMSEKDYSRLKKEIDEAADMNGLDKEKLFKEANTKVRTQYYSEFWDAFNKKDQKEVERIAEILKNLGVKKSQLIQSGKRRGILE